MYMYVCTMYNICTGSECIYVQHTHTQYAYHSVLCFVLSILPVVYILIIVVYIRIIIVYEGMRAYISVCYFEMKFYS